MMTGLHNTQCLIVLLKCQNLLTGNVLLGKCRFFWGEYLVLCYYSNVTNIN